MKFRLIRIPLLIVVAIFLLTACNQEPDLPPVVDVVPVVEVNTEAPVIVDLPPVENPVEVAEPPVEAPEQVQTEPEPEVVVENTTAVPAVGSTVQHEVQVGEWLMQIARCYGADYGVVRRANPNIWFPDYIKPGTMVTVPNVGSVGEVKGTPCVAQYTVVAGDTWSGLATRFGTTAVILQRVNPGLLWAGNKIIVPAYPTETTVPTLIVDPIIPQEPTSPQPTRIMFAAGETAVTLGGAVPAKGSVSYIFGARKGQEYKITLAPSQDDVTFSLSNPADAGQVLPSEGSLPVTGDYIVRVMGGAVDATFSLALSIVDENVGGGIILPDATRINFAPGTTSATVTGSVAAGKVTRYVFTASEGQKLVVNFVPNDPAVTYLVTPPQLGGQVPADGILPISGEYYIIITGTGVDAIFTMTLTITNP